MQRILHIIQKKFLAFHSTISFWEHLRFINEASLFDHIIQRKDVDKCPLRKSVLEVTNNQGQGLPSDLKRVPIFVHIITSGHDSRELFYTLDLLSQVAILPKTIFLFFISCSWQEKWTCNLSKIFPLNHFQMKI